MVIESFHIRQGCILLNFCLERMILARSNKPYRQGISSAKIDKWVRVSITDCGPDRTEKPDRTYFGIRGPYFTSCVVLGPVRSYVQPTILPSRTGQDRLGMYRTHSVRSLVCGFGLNRSRSNPGVFGPVWVWPDAHPYKPGMIFVVYS